MFLITRVLHVVLSVLLQIGIAVVNLLFAGASKYTAPVS